MSGPNLSREPGRTTRPLVDGPMAGTPLQALLGPIQISGLRLGLILLHRGRTVGSVVVKGGLLLQALDLRSGATGAAALAGLDRVPGDWFRLVELLQPIEDEARPLGDLVQLWRQLHDEVDADDAPTIVMGAIPEGTVAPENLPSRPPLAPPAAPPPPPPALSDEDEDDLGRPTDPAEGPTDTSPTPPRPQGPQPTAQLIEGRFADISMLDLLGVVALSARPLRVRALRGDEELGSLLVHAGQLVASDEQEATYAKKTLAALLRVSGVHFEVEALAEVPPVACGSLVELAVRASGRERVLKPATDRSALEEQVLARPATGSPSIQSSSLIVNDLAQQRQRLDRLVVEMRAIESELLDSRTRLLQIQSRLTWMAVAMGALVVGLTTVLGGLAGLAYLVLYAA